MSKIWSALNYDNTGHHSAVDPVSVTVPDQSMTIQEIVFRFRRGMPVSVANNEGAYYGDEDLPDLEDMDLADREEAVKAARAVRKDIEGRLKTLDEQRAKLKKEADAELEEIRKELRDRKSKPKADPASGG